MKITSHSLKETATIAESLANKIKRKKKDKAIVLILSGDLGVGKTTFVKSFIKAFGIKKKVTSPTFTLIRRYPSKKEFLFHVDAYRIRTEKELEVLDFISIITDPKNIVLIEWPEMIPKTIPKTAIPISISHGKNENERIIHLPTHI